MVVYHGPSLFASQADGLVQELSHLLVVGVVFPPWPAGNEPIVLQLGDVLFREALHTHTHRGLVYEDPTGLRGCLIGGKLNGRQKDRVLFTS